MNVKRDSQGKPIQRSESVMAVGPTSPPEPAEAWRDELFVNPQGHVGKLTATYKEEHDVLVAKKLAAGWKRHEPAPPELPTLAIDRVEWLAEGEVVATWDPRTEMMTVTRAEVVAVDHFAPASGGGADLAGSIVGPVSVEPNE